MCTDTTRVSEATVPLTAVEGRHTRAALVPVDRQSCRAETANGGWQRGRAEARTPPDH